MNPMSQDRARGFREGDALIQCGEVSPGALSRSAGTAVNRQLTDRR